MGLKIFFKKSNEFKILGSIIKYMTEKKLIIFILEVCNIYISIMEFFLSFSLKYLFQNCLESIYQNK